MWDRLRSWWGCDLALDLGADRTRIACPERGLVLDEPTVVAQDVHSGRILADGCAVGTLARQMEGRTPEGIVVQRPVRRGAIADSQQAEALLRCFLRKACGGSRRASPRVLAAVPSGATSVATRALTQALLRTGARQVLLLSKVKAAAIGAGLPVVEPWPSLICDLGGGVTEIAVLSVGDATVKESLFTAGADLDQAIVAWVRRNYQLRISNSTAEELKLAIGSAWPLAREVSAEAAGLDAISGTPRRASIASDEIREALHEPLSQIADGIRQLIDRCSLELSSELLDAGLVLAGGGAALPGIERFFAERCGLPARVAADAPLAVVQGTRACLEQMSRWRGMLERSHAA